MKLKFDRNQLADLVAKLPAKAKLMIVKDDGIYAMSFDEVPAGTTARTVVYARGYDPREGDVWQKCADAVGGDDFGEVFAKREELEKILGESEGDIIVNVTASTLSVSFIQKRTPEQIAARVHFLKDWLKKTEEKPSVLWSAKFKRTVNKAQNELMGLLVKQPSQAVAC